MGCSLPAVVSGSHTAIDEKAFTTQACRMLPWAINNFKLQEVTTVVDLRRLVNEVFKKNVHLTDPKVCTACQCAWAGHMQPSVCHSVSLNWPALALSCMVSQAIEVLLYKGREEIEVLAPLHHCQLLHLIHLRLHA